MQDPKQLFQENLNILTEFVEAVHTEQTSFQTNPAFLAGDSDSVIFIVPIGFN